MFWTLLFLFLILPASCVIPEEYAEIEDTSKELFSVKYPLYLAYTYQMQPAYLLGGRFGKEPNFTIHDVEIIKAVPFTACVPLANNVRGKVVLIERGECTFLTKAMHAQNGGAIITLITDTAKASSLSPRGRDYVYMLTDSTLDRAKIPVAFVCPNTGHMLGTYLADDDTTIIADIPIRKNVNPWFEHIRKAPWEDWNDHNDLYLF